MESVTIGQYRVTGVIGRGGMGTVYAGEHVLLDRPAAIKVLLPELSHREDVVMRFFNEARAATAIRHPGIVEIYDFGWSADGTAFIVMERLEGETLTRRAARVRFGWQAVLAIARQIASALAAAHAKGIVHRDLKPDNVFLVLDPDIPGGERIKLLDFGIAKLGGDALSGRDITKTGAIMGTPTYMAPEQCRGVATDHRADLYALGCIVFELCTGRPPFVGEGTGDVLAAHIHTPAPSVATLTTEIPYAVEQLIQRLLAKALAERVPSAEQLIRAIDAIASDGTRSLVVSSESSKTQPRMVTTLSGAASAGTRRPTRSGSHRGRALVSAAAVAISLAVVVLVMRSGGDDVSRVPPPPTSPPSAIAVPLKRADVPSTQAPLRTPAAAPTPTAGVAPQPQAPALPSAKVDVSVETVRTGAHPFESARPPPTPLPLGPPQTAGPVGLQKADPKKRELHGPPGHLGPRVGSGSATGRPAGTSSAPAPDDDDKWTHMTHDEKP